jgi:hypothetical protein
VQPSPPGPTLADLVGARLLDAPLAALAWLLAERGIPVHVAGSPPGADVARDELVEAIVGALPADRRPEPAAVRGERLVRVAGTLSLASPAGVVRAALAATTGRSGLATTVEADDLAGVLAVLARQGLTADEVAFLGCVLVVRTPPEVAGRPRVVAAHYLRPLVRDAGGHPRRLEPAVLAAWDPRGDRWEDFAWGIVPDLAERARLRAGDFETERARRAVALAGDAPGRTVG